MSRAPSLEQALVADLHRAALDPAGWQDMVHRIEAAFGGARASLHGVDGPSGGVFLSAAGAFDPAAAESYLVHYHRINPFLPASLRIPPGQARRSVMDLPDEVLFRSEFYNDWMRPQEALAGAVAVKCRPSGTRMLVLSMNLRRRDREQGEPRVQRLFQRMEPHLSHALAVSEAVSALSMPAPHADGEPPARGGLLVTDRAGRVVWADAGAMRMQGHLLRIDPLGRLVFRDAAAQDWAEAVRRQLADPGAVPPPFRLAQAGRAWTIRCLPREESAAVSPLFPGNFWAAGRTQRTLLFLLSPDTAGAAPGAALIRRFGLSAVEADVALCLGRGATTAEIAAMRQVSLHTVRNQIRAILRKMQCRHRSEITRIVMEALETGRPDLR